MTDDQLIKNAQNPYLYGKFLDVGTAFNKGLVQASKFGNTQITDPAKAVKNNYEDQLAKYLNKLPADVDLGGIPDKYRNSISNFLMTQKQNYVNLANQVNEYEVGSEMYMDITNQMNQIRGSFETLNSQMKMYGENKKEIIGNIQNQSTSLSPENQANVNMLRSVYNEEFDLSIDEYGNVSFAGDDGMVGLNNLPGYEVKDYKLAQGMLKMGDQVYNAGIILQPGGVKYNQYANQLTLGIDQGGRNSLMSVVYDGLIGGVRMIDDPMVAQNVDAYKGGDISFEDLRDVVVNKYMEALVENSKQGYGSKRKTVPTKGGNKNSKNNKDSADADKASKTISYDGMQLTPKQAKEFVQSRNPLEFNAILNNENLDKTQKAAKMDELAIKMGLSFDDVWLDGKMPEKSFETGGKSDFSVTEYFLNKNK